MDIFSSENNEGYYEGDFVSNMKQGQGTIVWTSGSYSGDSYEGQWHHGMKHGFGTYKYHCGDIYVGEWYGIRMPRC
jgi:hypothetical protein